MAWWLGSVSDAGDFLQSTQVRAEGVSPGRGEGNPGQTAGVAARAGLGAQGGAVGARSQLSRSFIGALDLRTLDCLFDVGGRLAPGFDQNNQHGQDGDRPGDRSEEHQADRH
jgi:hypothetical protein